MLNTRSMTGTMPCAAMACAAWARSATQPVLLPTMRKALTMTGSKSMLAAVPPTKPTVKTVPPTAALVSKLFGVRYLGTLFGLTLLSHQIGGFLGAWLGGLAIVNTGSYAWMWWADAALALLAALVNLPIDEAKVQRSAPAAA